MELRLPYWMENRASRVSNAVLCAFFGVGLWWPVVYGWRSCDSQIIHMDTPLTVTTAPDSIVHFKLNGSGGAEALSDEEVGVVPGLKHVYNVEECGFKRLEADCFITAL
eukprot:1984614-Amphidinium_carterae.1